MRARVLYLLAQLKGREQKYVNRRERPESRFAHHGVADCARGKIDVIRW